MEGEQISGASGSPRRARHRRHRPGARSPAATEALSRAAAAATTHRSSTPARRARVLLGAADVPTPGSASSRRAPAGGDDLTRGAEDGRPCLCRVRRSQGQLSARTLDPGRRTGRQCGRGFGLLARGVLRGSRRRPLPRSRADVVPTWTWDKPGPLTASERERVRLHSYYTERGSSAPRRWHRSAALRLSPRAPRRLRLPPRGRRRASRRPRPAPGRCRRRRRDDAQSAGTSCSAPSRRGRRRRDVGRGPFDATRPTPSSRPPGGTDRPRRALPRGLTPRELEVLRLPDRARRTGRSPRHS